MKKLAALALTLSLFGSIGFGTAHAFQDLDPDNKEAILSLKERGFVSGIDGDHFVPQGKISYAEAVQLLVKAFSLNMDNLRFIKQPLASDIYTSVPDDAWYADAFLISHYNGLTIPKDVNPAAAITREQFGALLMGALEKQGPFPMVKIYINVTDSSDMTPEFQGALQRMLVLKIAHLEPDGTFKPKGELTRGQAAIWVNNALKVLERQKEKPAPTEKVDIRVEQLSGDVNKVTLSRGEKPNAGYGIRITGIQFDADGHAVITYKLSNPESGKMYAEVITVPEAVTYVSTAYQVTAQQETGSK